MQAEVKKGLSKREKILLSIVLVFGIFAIMVMFVIIPLYNDLSDKTTLYNELTVQKIQIETKLSTEAATRENHTVVLARHKTNSERFLNTSLSNEIGRMLTTLCDEHGLSPVSQQLSNPKDFTKILSSSGSRPSADDKNGKETVFLMVTATMTVKGDYEDLKSLLDTVEQIEYIRVSRVSLGRDTANPELVLNKITVTFEVTMLKDVSPDV